IEVLKGKTLMQRVVKELGLETSYYLEKTFSSTELYGKDLPLKLTIHGLDSTAYELSDGLLITILDNNNFELDDGESVKKYSFGKQVSKSYGQFTLTSSSGLEPFTTYRVRFHNLT